MLHAFIFGFNRCMVNAIFHKAGPFGLSCPEEDVIRRWTSGSPCLLGHRKTPETVGYTGVFFIVNQVFGYGG